VGPNGATNKRPIFFVQDIMRNQVVFVSMAFCMQIFGCLPASFCVHTYDFFRTALFTKQCSIFKESHTYICTALFKSTPESCAFFIRICKIIFLQRDAFFFNSQIADSKEDFKKALRQRRVNTRVRPSAPPLFYLSALFFHHTRAPSRAIIFTL